MINREPHKNRSSIGAGPRNRRHARYLSDHPPFSGSSEDEIVKLFRPSLLSAKNILRCTRTRIIHLPIVAFPCHNVYAGRPGRGFTEYKLHRQGLSSLPF